MAAEAHFVDHLAAVFGALPPDARGAFLTSDAKTTARAVALGYATARPNGGRDPVLVASYGDLARARAMGRPRIAIMEHGAGQSYGGRPVSADSGSYAGGSGRGAASLFLHPGPHPAARERKAYPRARVEVVGSPYLDRLPNREGPAGRVVAFSFHFNGAVCAETKTAYPAFFPAIVELAKRYQVIGTAHPRLWNQGGPSKIADRYRKYGIEPVESFAEVCRKADLLIFDNTSAGFAFAATGRPVVVLNPPWYDARVRHGLRFWEAAEVGLNCNDPADLASVIAEAFRDTPAQQAKREGALDMVYGFRTGASQRAADVLMDWIQ